VTTLARSDPPRPGSSLLWFLALSLLLHALLLLWFGPARFATDDGEKPPLVVKLAPAPGTLPPKAQPAPPQPAAAPQVQEQIVAPSDRENELPPLGRAYLSDRDNRVERETVRRGNPEAGAPSEPDRRAAVVPPRAPPPPRAEPAPPQQVAKPAPPKAAKPAPREAKPAERTERAEAAARRAPAPAPAKQRVAPARAARPAPRRPTRELPGLGELLPPPAEVLARARGGEGGSQGAPDPRSDPRRDLVSAPPPAPGLFAGMRGTFDDLPEVAAGNLTMLNTKADRFAPFVRRVGTRVFQNLLIYQRRDLDVPEILAANRIVTVKALLDRKGRLKDLEVVDRSGSHAVDETLVDALREAAFDQNPPGEAANENGEFEFVFQAQLSAGVEPGADGPRVRTIES
jgi:TonB family protein